MATELGHAVADVLEDPFERREVDVPFVLEVPAIPIDGAHARDAEPLALRVVMRADRGPGLLGEGGDRPLESGVVVEPVVRVEMGRRVSDELRGTGVLGAVFDERLVRLRAAGAEERRRWSRERTVGFDERGDALTISHRSRIGERQVHAHVERWRRARDAPGLLARGPADHEGRRGHDAVAMRAHDAGVHARRAPEVIRVDDEPLHC